MAHPTDTNNSPELDKPEPNLDFLFFANNWQKLIFKVPGTGTFRKVAQKLMLVPIHQPYTDDFSHIPALSARYRRLQPYTGSFNEIPTPSTRYPQEKAASH